LQLVDLIVGKLPPRHTAIMDMVYLRDRVGGGGNQRSGPPNH
jgi:hypothetical protein